MLAIYKKDAEKKFLDLLGKLKEEQGYYVTHFKFSELLDHYKNEYQHKISINIISDILEEADGYIIESADFDIFVVCTGIFPNVLKKLIFQLRYLYMDDPLAYDGDNNENPAFCQIYDLRTNWKELFQIARIKQSDLIQKEKSKHEKRPAPQEESTTELTPQRLVRVEQELGKTNITDDIRMQPVCASKAEGFTTMFNEAYINIAALSSSLKSGVNLTSNRWLFRYLTEILDHKMLEHISKNTRKMLKNPISINLNVETLLSHHFTEFDRHLDEKTRKNIIIELQIADIFADMPAFAAAREIVQGLGYRICIDGLTSASLTHINRELLGFDLAKMFWNAEIRNNAKTLKEAVERCGKGRIILARCDAADAVYYGQSLGINLFQGRYVDSIVNPDSNIIN